MGRLSNWVEKPCVARRFLKGKRFMIETEGKRAWRLRNFCAKKAWKPPLCAGRCWNCSSRDRSPCPTRKYWRGSPPRDKNRTERRSIGCFRLFPALRSFMKFRERTALPDFACTNPLWTSAQEIIPIFSAASAGGCSASTSSRSPAWRFQRVRSSKANSCWFSASALNARNAPVKRIY